MNKNIIQSLFKAIQNKKAIIWDLDGVIIFANWHYGENWNKWWDRLWIILEKYDPNVRAVFKNGLKHFYEHTNYIAGKFGKSAQDEIKSFFKAKESLIFPVSPLNEEIIQFIKNIPNDIEQYIWSNNYEKSVLYVLKKVGIQGKIKGIISRDKVILAKPELEGFKIIQNLTSIPIKDFILIGDSETTDRVAAERLGIDFFKYIK